MKKMILKKLFGVVALAGCLVSLAACEKTDWAHTIVFYSTQGDSLQTVTQTAITEFENENPGWKVQHTQVGGYDDVKAKVIADLQAQTQPDLAYCYADHVAQYLKTEKVVDMKDLVTAELKADLVEGYFAEGLATNYGDYGLYGYADDSLLTLPFSKSTELMYYNKTVLDELSLQPAQTWDELWQQAAIIKEEYPSMVTLGYDSEANWFITMCEQNGWGYTSASGNHYLFNNPECAAWLDQLHEYYQEGYFTTQALYGSYTSNLFVKGSAEGGCVYCIGSSGGASYQFSSTFNVGIAHIPGSTGEDLEKPNAVISQGPSLVMFKTQRSDNVDEKVQMTYKFIEKLLAPNFQMRFSKESGYNPVNLKAYNEVYSPDDNETQTFQEFLDNLTEVTKKTDMTAMASKVAYAMSDDFYSSPAFVGSSNARTQVGVAIQYACSSFTPGADLLADAYTNCGGQ